MSAYTDHAGAFLIEDAFAPIGGIVYRTLSEIRWELWRTGSGSFFTVPADTLFDVSVPRWLRWAFDPHDRRFLKAAALHDEMLRQGIDGVRAAAEFNQALKADGVSRRRRLAMTAAVALHRFE